MKAYVVKHQDLIENIQMLKEQAGDVPIWAVLKGNGYGIGIIPLAQTLVDEDIHQFCVTELREVQLLREAGFTEERILLLRSTADATEIAKLLDWNVIMTVGSYETAEVIDRVAAAKDTMAEIHLKIDTGMGRYGFFPADIERMISVYRDMTHILVGGVYTHFNCAYGKAKQTLAQFEQFSKAVKSLQDAGYETGTVHCCNSSAFLRFPQMYCDGVRLGSALLGRVAVKTKLPLHRIGYMEATVEEIRWLPKGHSIGYDGAWTAKGLTRVAVVDVGWYHGVGLEHGDDTYRFVDCLHQILHNLKCMILPPKNLVKINGSTCQTLGHTAMVHTFVDVTKIECKVGDKVILPVKPLFIKGVKIQYR